MRAAPIVMAAAAAGGLSACLHDACEGVDTCVSVDVDSFTLKMIDQLELDIVYDGRHATTTTGTRGESRSLPVSFPLTLDLAGSPLIKLDVIAAGRLDGVVLGLDHGSTTVQQGSHGSLSFFLDAEPTPCVEGALYCGGVGSVFADGSTLYRCTAGVPIFYATCSSGCTPHQDEGVCVGLGLCRDGGQYCGGHSLDGDPGVLYTCMSFHGTAPVRCPLRCLVDSVGDGDDACM